MQLNQGFAADIKKINKYHVMKMQSTYMGLQLNSPIVVSACTLSEQTDNIVQMEESGAGAVVLFSLFEEQIRREESAYKAVMSGTSNSFAEAADYFPDLEDFNVGKQMLTLNISTGQKEG